MNTERNDFEKREQEILKRIQVHYGKKLGRIVNLDEAMEIADNLLGFAKAVYGSKA